LLYFLFGGEGSYHFSTYTPEKAVNIKIQVYDKLKDYETLIGLYEQAFQLGRSVTTKSHNLFRLVDAYVHLKNYEAALGACKRWEQFYRQNRYSSDAGKTKGVEPNIARYKAICYYHMTQVEEAKKIATDLVRLNPADKVALAILDGSLEDTDTMEKDVDISELDDMDDFLQDEETEGDRTRLLSQFVQDKIQNIDLNTSLKARHVENEKYISTRRHASEDIQKLSHGLQGMSARNRCESLFAACRLLEIIHQSTDWKFNFNSELIYSGRAMAFWADYTVSQSSTMDSPRMGYLYALKVLRLQPKEQAEQGWVDSFNRYIKSYFIAQKGSASSLESYIAQQATVRDKDKANTDAFQIPLPKVLIPEFLVGMMQLYDALDSQETDRENLLADLYHKNQKLRADLIQQLRERYQCDLEKDAALDAFKSAFKAGCSLRAQKLDALRSSLQEAANILTLEPLSVERLSCVDSKNLKPFLNSADFKRLNAFHHLLNHYQDYFGTDFDAREECLRSTLNEAEGLINTIQAEPTDVSYEMFLPILTQISVRLREEQDALYLDFQPNIKLTLGLHAFRTPNEHGWLQIEITVENAQNYQTAEDFSIDSVGGAEIEDGNNLHSETIPSLRGGIPVGLELTVKVVESALQAGSFTMQVNYSYQCRTSVDQEKRYSKNSEIMVVIHTDNTGKLANPYSRCMNGQPVQEKAMFYGRDEQIEEIVTAIGGREDGVMNYGSAIAIYGQTRTGKSSVLFHLQQCLANRYPDQVIIWDMGNIGEITGSDHKISFLSPFLYYMLDIGYQALMDNPLVGSILSEKKLEPPLDEILMQPDIASVKFTTYMKRVNAVLKENNCIIVLVLDEFTYLHGAIKDSRISTDFMKFWKALLQDYCIFSVVAGQDDMIEFMHEYQNEFACMSAMKLNYLDENSAKQLIREPLKRANQDRGPFDENDLGLFAKEKTIESIYKLTAGSAYLINVLCSNLVDYVNERGAYKISDALFEAFLRERVFVPKSKSCFKEEQHFESHLQERGHDELNEANKAILLSIARNSKGTGYARLDDIDCKGKSPDEIKMLVERLEKRDVLVREVQAGRDAYSIQVKLLEKWLISTEGE
ncbi:MAG: ATP-binding protein, partial [Clostridiales bacterium]|nr:ATP-binding protein [Clostridiales bacterium]